MVEVTNLCSSSWRHFTVYSTTTSIGLWPRSPLPVQYTKISWYHYLFWTAWPWRWKHAAIFEISVIMCQSAWCYFSEDLDLLKLIYLLQNF